MHRSNTDSSAGAGSFATPEPEIRRWLADRVARVTGVEAGEVDPTASFLALGLDSVTAAGLMCDLEAHLSRRLPASLIGDYDTIEDLAGYLHEHGKSLPPIALAPAGEPVAPAAHPTRDAWLASLTERVSQMRANDAFFYEPTLSQVDGAWAVVDGQRMLMMASYSYLGLIGHPRINEAAAVATREYGTGSHAARLLGGTTDLHAQLEAKIAQFKKSEAAVAFTSGFVTNISTIGALVGPGDAVIGDSLNHASLVDGCRFCGATFTVFDHKDLATLAAQLQRADGVRTLVVVDAVFSMDGDHAPLPEIVGLCRQHGAMLMVDEAHSVGVMGPTGRGIAEHFGLPSDVIDVQMGTLSKTIPSIGGYIAGSRRLIEALKYNARGWIFSGALPPPQVAAASAALDVMADEPWRVETLRRNTKRYVDGLRAGGLAVHDGRTPIVPIRCPDEPTTFEMTRRCKEAGLLVYPIVHPAVPADQPRIRTTVTTAHSEQDIDLAVEVLCGAARAVGLVK